MMHVLVGTMQESHDIFVAPFSCRRMGLESVVVSLV